MGGTFQVGLLPLEEEGRQPSPYHVMTQEVLVGIQWVRPQQTLIPWHLCVFKK